MFYSLTGKLVHMEPGVVAIECGGVAFKCFTSMNTQKNMPRIGETATVYTHLNVREDALDLYGFSTKSELNCYKMLTTISGVGPKAALSILSEMTPEGVAMAAASGDSKKFTKASGVGPKLAQRIVLELKDHGFTDGKVHIAHCDNPEAAKRLKLMIHAVFAGAQVDVTECGGLCSYYAEQGGLMVGFEDGEAEA